MMRKILFLLLLIIGLILTYTIGRIFIYDYDRLTDYGFGYLIGLIIILLLIISITGWLGIKIYRKKSQS
ncbi:type III secretory pathway component EscS [Flavobacterium sp. 28YEA47A]